MCHPHPVAGGWAVSTRAPSRHPIPWAALPSATNKGGRLTLTLSAACCRAEKGKIGRKGKSDERRSQKGGWWWKGWEGRGEEEEEEEEEEGENLPFGPRTLSLRCAHVYSHFNLHDRVESFNLITFPFDLICVVCQWQCHSCHRIFNQIRQWTRVKLLEIDPITESSVNWLCKWWLIKLSS